MLATIELTPRRAEALAQLERDTGENQAALLARALDSYIERKREESELLADIEQGRADIAAGRVHTSAEVMAAAMAAIAKAKQRKADK